MNVEQLKEKYVEGMSIVLEEMNGESRMPSGLKGTVKRVDDMGQIHMKWENGSSLALNIEEDRFSIDEVEKIKVLLVEPNKYPKIIEIEDRLEAMQEVVGGYIEEYMPFDDEVAIICNGEGKMNGAVLNRAIYSESNEKKEMIEIVCGSFFICYAPIESEKFLSLPEDLAKKYQTKFKYPEKFFKDFNGKIIAEPFKPKSKEMER